MASSKATTRDMFATEYVLCQPTADDAQATFMAPVFRMQIVRESTAEAPVKITSPADAYNFCFKGRFEGCDRENLAVLLLDTKNKVIGLDIVFVGTLNCSMVTMREVFKSAVALGAAAIIVCHNHPSGDPTPSPEDVLVTREIVAAGKLLDIDVLDHHVLGHNKYVSLRERGLGFA